MPAEPGGIILLFSRCALPAAASGVSLLCGARKALLVCALAPCRVQLRGMSVPSNTHRAVASKGSLQRGTADIAKVVDQQDIAHVPGLPEQDSSSSSSTSDDEFMMIKTFLEAQDVMRRDVIPSLSWAGPSPYNVSYVEGELRVCACLLLQSVHLSCWVIYLQTGLELVDSLEVGP